MNRAFLIKMIFILFIMGLYGCAQPVYKINEAKSIGGLGSKTVVIVDDQRPETDKKHSFGSFLVTSSDYGIWILGDDKFDPNVIELLKYHTIKHVSTKRKQPKSIKITLKRLIVQSNHQANLLREGSQNLGPLGVVIAEKMHGKKFEMSLDKTKPFVLGFIDSAIEINYGNNIVKKNLSLSKAENFSSHTDEKGRKKAATNVINNLLSSFSKSMI